MNIRRDPEGLTEKHGEQQLTNRDYKNELD